MFQRSEHQAAELFAREIAQFDHSLSEGYMKVRARIVRMSGVKLDWVYFTFAAHLKAHVRLIGRHNATRTDSFGGADGCDLTPKKGN